jgi:hypothetical protein
MAQVNYGRGPLRARLESLFSDFFTGFATGLDVANLVDAAGATTTITVPGVALGDHVISIAFSVDLAGITATAYVSAANTVSIRTQNESGGVVDLAAASVSVLVGRPDPNYFRASLS